MPYLRSRARGRASTKSLLWTAVLCAACGSDDPVVTGVGNPAGDAGVGAADGGGFVQDGGNQNGASGCNEMDLLFVIDNSGSMSEEQTNLATNFPNVIRVLEALRAGSVNYRIGVTTTSIGADFSAIPWLASSNENGALLKTTDMQHPWLDKGEPNLAQRFTQLATVGTGGSGNEQPLRAALAAVTDRVSDGANAGFHRTNALLAIVMLTDEDDSSSTMEMLDPILGLIPLPGAERPVSEYVAGFDGAAMARGNWATAVIAGDKMEGCESAFGEANYAGRLVEFVKLTGPNAVLGSICQGDLAGELDKALNVFTNACETFIPLF